MTRTAVYLLLFVAGVARPAFSQEEAPGDTTDAPPGDATPAADDAGTDTPAATEDERAESDAAVSGSASTSGAATAADATLGEKPAAPAAQAGPGVAVEVLPGSAYPNHEVSFLDGAITGGRGIEGGSLWMTMHGLQWPYMPALGDEPAVRLGLSGSIWVDTSYRFAQAGRHPSSDTNTKEWRGDSRGVLRASPTYSRPSGFFAQAVAELVGNTNVPGGFSETIVVDDLYARVGKWGSFDFQIGRYQGWEVYHFGMGLDENTYERRGAYSDRKADPVGIYGLTRFWNRPTAANQVAVHLYPIGILRDLGVLECSTHCQTVRIEGLAQVGNLGGHLLLGYRPVAIVDLGVLKLKGGMEYGKTYWWKRGDNAEKYSIQNFGFGAGASVVVNPWVELGASAAQETVHVLTDKGILDPGPSNTIRSVGAFLNVSPLKGLIVGGGVHYTKRENMKDSPPDPLQPNLLPQHDQEDHLQPYGAVQYALWGQFYVKAVGAYARYRNNPLSDQDPKPYENKARSLRLRFMYNF